MITIIFSGNFLYTLLLLKKICLMDSNSQKEYNLIYRKVSHQVLIDPSISKLLKKIGKNINQKPSAIIRDLVNKFVENNSDPEEFKFALEEDQKLKDLAQESRINNGFNWKK